MVGYLVLNFHALPIKVNDVSIQCYGVTIQLFPILTSIAIGLTTQVILKVCQYKGYHIGSIGIHWQQYKPDSASAALASVFCYNQEM
mgnify:CR=1 FL=1